MYICIGICVCIPNLWIYMKRTCNFLLNINPLWIWNFPFIEWFAMHTGLPFLRSLSIFNASFMAIKNSRKCLQCPGHWTSVWCTSSYYPINGGSQKFSAFERQMDFMRMKSGILCDVNIWFGSVGISSQCLVSGGW